MGRHESTRDQVVDRSRGYALDGRAVDLQVCDELGVRRKRARRRKDARTGITSRVVARGHAQGRPVTIPNVSTAMPTASLTSAATDLSRLPMLMTRAMICDLAHCHPRDVGSRTGSWPTAGG